VQSIPISCALSGFSWDVARIPQPFRETRRRDRDAVCRPDCGRNTDILSAPRAVRDTSPSRPWNFWHCRAVSGMRRRTRPAAEQRFVLSPYDKREGMKVSCAAKKAGRSAGTIRNWCEQFEIKRPQHGGELRPSGVLRDLAIRKIPAVRAETAFGQSFCLCCRRG
jgi:hypothetical protein